MRYHKWNDIKWAYGPPEWHVHEYWIVADIPSTFYWGGVTLNDERLLQVFELLFLGGGIEEDFMKCLAPLVVGEFTLKGSELFDQAVFRNGFSTGPFDFSSLKTV